jgi:hypothetical protein
MRKFLYIGAALTTLLVGSFAYASGVTFLTGGSLVFKSGGSATYLAPTGTIDATMLIPGNAEPAIGQYIQRAAQLGIKWGRIEAPWYFIESSQGVYDWTVRDSKVNDAIANGIQVLLLLDKTPTWAAYPSCASPASGGCAPVDAATFATFCSAAASHFDGKVKYYEVWNEENQASNWGPAATTTDYVSALNACYTAIKAVNSSDQVLVGGLAPVATSAGNISVVDFVTQAYADAPVRFDIMGQHPYSYPSNLSTGNASNNGWQAMLAVEGLMSANGDGAKKIWITEVGAPTCGPNATLLQYQKSLADQVIAAVQSSTTIGKTFWFSLIDTDSNDPSTSEN